MGHEHYFRDVPAGVSKVDVYRLLEMFDVTCPVAQHVIKKALAAGQRGHKNTVRDWSDIRDSAERKLQMIEEDDAVTWNEGQSRMDNIARNGNDGLAYNNPNKL